MALSNQISGIIEQLFLISGAQPPLFGRVLVPALSHGTLIVINYHRRTAGEVIEYTSYILIVLASTVCSDQVHTFLWYVSCLSSYRKLLVILSSWPKGCYLIEVSGGWMFWDRTICENEYWLTNPLILTENKTNLCYNIILLSKFDWHLIIFLPPSLCLTEHCL